MDATATFTDAKSAPAPKKRGVRTKRPVKPISLQRQNRWKRRGSSTTARRVLNVVGFVALAVAVFAVLALTSAKVDTGPEGPLAKSVYEAFPEADPQRIDISVINDLPSTVILHLPAHMIEPSRGLGDPFAELGARFGRAERTLSGLEMAARIEQVSAALLPDEAVKCHTYDVGGISSPPEAPRRTRALYVHLNPGC
jgi:hypothetical protein